VTRSIIFRPIAEIELADAAAWYEQQRTGLGADFFRAFEAAMAAIRRNLFQYQVVEEEIRRAPLRRFPYSIIYVVSDDELLILSCFHGRRDPARWRESSR
jgi:hypothetical protein